MNSRHFTFLLHAFFALNFLAISNMPCHAAPQPSGTAYYYATPFGVLSWNDIDIWTWSNFNWNYGTALSATMTPASSGAQDDLGNPYFALLAFDDYNDGTRSAEYYIYQNGITLTTRLKQSGGDPFPELATAVLRDVEAITISGFEGGAGYWCLRPGTALLNQIEIFAIYQNLDYFPAVDENGNLIFACFEQWSYAVGGDIHSIQGLRLNTDGTLTSGSALFGWASIITPGTPFNMTNLQAVTAVLPEGAVTGYVGIGGVWVAWEVPYTWWYIHLNDGVGVMQASDTEWHLAVDLYEPDWWSGLFNVSANPNGSLSLSLDTYSFGFGYGAFVDGGVLVPASFLSGTYTPIQNFEYGGESYVFSSVDFGGPNGELVTTFTGDFGGTATMEWMAADGSLVSLGITTADSQTANYVPGSSVGRPGGYVLTSGSTAPNMLTRVDGTIYMPSGDLSQALSGQFAGDLDVFGNTFSLGSWTDNPNNAGMSLTYIDGSTPESPAQGVWTMSRPYARWNWDRATGSGSSTATMMELSKDNALTLFDPTISSPPTVGVVLDPGTGGVSEFKHEVRFNGRVRVAPQGDLLMGTFTAEP